MNDKALGRRVRAWQTRKENELRAQYNELLSTRRGRDFLWHLLDVAKWNTQPFTGKRDLTDFACGELNVGIQIHSRIVETAADGFLQMLKDRQDEQRELANLIGADNASDTADPADRPADDAD